MYYFQQPGKLNLKNFSVVTEAIARMNVGGKDARVSNTSLGHAPLALPEVVDLGSEYAQVKLAENQHVTPPTVRPTVKCYFYIISVFKLFYSNR